MGNCPGAVWGVVGDAGGPPPRKRRLTILLNAVSVLNASYMRARGIVHTLPSIFPLGFFYASTMNLFYVLRVEKLVVPSNPHGYEIW